jgi:hypothetical protein
VVVGLGVGAVKLEGWSFIPADLAHTRTRARVLDDLSLFPSISLSFSLPGDRLTEIEGFCSVSASTSLRAGSPDCRRTTQTKQKRTTLVGLCLRRRSQWLWSRRYFRLGPKAVLRHACRSYRYGLDYNSNGTMTRSYPCTEKIVRNNFQKRG